jgi:hypothetical protein
MDGVFQRVFHRLFLSRAMRSGYQVEGGTKKAANPEVSPPAAMVLQMWMHWWAISFVSMEKGTSPGLSQWICVPSVQS